MMVQAIIAAVSRAIADSKNGSVLRAFQQMLAEIKASDPATALQIQQQLSAVHAAELEECEKLVAYYQSRQQALQDLLGVKN